MKTTALGALALTLPLAGALGACSSGDNTSSAASGNRGSGSSPSASSTPTTLTKPAVRLAGHGGGVATYCVPPGKHGYPDFAWTGVRPVVRADATITSVGAQTQQVDILHSWIVPGGNGNTGAFVPWAKGQMFLRKLDWKHRVAAKGADLKAGTAYTLVLRLRPHDHPLPGQLQQLEVDYRSAGGEGSVTDPDLLKFDKSC